MLLSLAVVRQVGFHISVIIFVLLRSRLRLLNTFVIHHQAEQVLLYGLLHVLSKFLNVFFGVDLVEASLALNHLLEEEGVFELSFLDQGHHLAVVFDLLEELDRHVVKLSNNIIRVC